jgi:hypothetical protein
MSDDKRGCERFAVATTAQIHVDNEIVAGEVKDISLSGAFVLTDRSMEPNADVELSIENPLSEGTDNIEAKVARVTDNGVGLQFKKPLFDPEE